MPATELSVTTIPELPEMTSAEVTGATLIPVHLEDLSVNKSRQITKTAFLSEIETTEIDAEDAEITDLTIEDSLTFEGASTITSVYLGSANTTFADLAAGASETVTAVLSGISVGDFLSVSFVTPLAPGLICSSWISASGEVSIRLTNVTTSLIAGATYAARASVIEGA